MEEIKMTYNEELILLKEADKYIQDNNTEAAKKIFNIVFKNDTFHIYAVILTESNPEYSIFSKEFNRLLNKYYIDILMDKMNNISNELNKLNII